MSNVDAIINALIDDKPSNATEILSKELKIRVKDAIEVIKPEVADKAFNKNKEKSDETDN